MTVADCIRILRASAGLKQHELAARAGISPSLLSLIESGKRDATIPVLKAIAGALNIPANVLFAAALDSDSTPQTPAEQHARNLTERLFRLAQKFILAERALEQEDDSDSGTDSCDAD